MENGEQSMGMENCITYVRTLMCTVGVSVTVVKVRVAHVDICTMRERE